MSVSALERLFGYSEKGIGGDIEFSDFLRSVGYAFLHYELPYVPVSSDVKEFLRKAGIRCRVSAFLSLLLGAIRIYEERQSFRTSIFPPVNLFRPFGISDEAICRYIGLSGLLVLIAKTNPRSSIDGVVSVQKILTSACKGAVTFRRVSPCPGRFSGFSSPHTPFVSGKSRTFIGHSRLLPFRVMYREADVEKLRLRGLSYADLGMFLRTLRSISLSLRQSGQNAICGSEIMEEFLSSFHILSVLGDKFSGCVFSVNPDTGFFSIESSGGEDFLLLVSDE